MADTIFNIILYAIGAFIVLIYVFNAVANKYDDKIRKFQPSVVEQEKIFVFLRDNAIAALREMHQLRTEMFFVDATTEKKLTIFKKRMVLYTPVDLITHGTNRGWGIPVEKQWQDLRYPVWLEKQLTDAGLNRLNYYYPLSQFYTLNMCINEYENWYSSIREFAISNIIKIQNDVKLEKM